MHKITRFGILRSAFGHVGRFFITFCASCTLHVGNSHLGTAKVEEYRAVTKTKHVKPGQMMHKSMFTGLGTNLAEPQRPLQESSRSRGTMAGVCRPSQLQRSH